MDKRDLKDEKLLYNVRETAAVLGVNVHLVYELINRKLLPALRLGSLKVRKSTLIDFVESDFPLYLNTVAGGLDRRDQTIGGFSFVVKIYAVPVVEIIG